MTNTNQAAAPESAASLLTEQAEFTRRYWTQAAKTEGKVVAQMMKCSRCTVATYCSVGFQQIFSPCHDSSLIA